MKRLGIVGAAAAAVLGLMASPAMAGKTSVKNPNKSDTVYAHASNDVDP